MSLEVWKPIPGWPYEASSFGRVRSIARVVKRRIPAGLVGKPGSSRTRTIPEKILNGRPRSDGYRFVALSLGNKRWDVGINVLVCLAFRGSAPQGKPHALHWNGNRSDNRLDNLRWGSRQENYQDQVRHGRGFAGEGNPNAKINWQLARAIRRYHRRAEGILRLHNYVLLSVHTSDGMMTKFGITRDIFNDVVKNRSWKE